MGKVELLAPAGDMDCFRAAINAGADAVYLGGEEYGARAYSFKHSAPYFPVMHIWVLACNAKYGKFSFMTSNAPKS